MVSPVGCLKTIYGNRYLVSVWVWRELRSKYQGSAGGWLWAVLFPVAMMGTYFFIFSFFLKIRVPYAPGAAGYFLFLMSALLPWGATAEAITRATTIFIEQAPLVQKVAFPLEVLPTFITFAAFFQPLIGLAIFAVIAGFVKGLNFGCVLALPLVLAIQFIFTLGIVFFLSALSVFLRDISQSIPVLLQIWFFASPILYPESMVPTPLRWINQINPLSMLASIYHGLFLKDQVMIWQIGVLFLYAVVLWVIGVLVFTRLKDSVPDLV